MSRIIFIPVCENCGYEFKELVSTSYFAKKCPRCENILNTLAMPKWECLIKENIDNLSFEYNKQEIYE